MNRDDDLIDFNKEDDFDDSILNKDGYAEYKEYEDCDDYQLDPEIMNSNDKEAPSKGKPTKDNSKKENSKKEKRKEKEQTSIAREILSWILTFSLAILVALILKNFIIINAVVPTGSMENTIMSESNLFGNRLAYINSDPKRGDIIIFKYPDNEEEKYVKRIIGLPGEKVTIDEAKVYIDGKELEEDYIKEAWTRATGPFEFEVPEDCYLVLGDNRNDSLDARYWTNTYVHRDKIIAKAVLIYYPFNRFGLLE
ncbi:MAG: signal peptidase I [Agathobacter sp.]|nr:signal peptidase I [Agathobacter sp.]